MASSTPLDCQLWQWCDVSYEQNKARYLELQDNNFVNINLLLLAQYLDLGLSATMRRYYSPAQWQQLDTTIKVWNDTVISPFRQLRRLAKTHVNQQEYQQMLDLELMMERKAQRKVLNNVNTLIPEGDQSNVVSYLGLFDLGQQEIDELALISPSSRFQPLL